MEKPNLNLIEPASVHGGVHEDHVKPLRAQAVNRLLGIDARKRHHLSHVHVQMARELGVNPMMLGKLDNHQQEPWKLTLREYIEHTYLKRSESLLRMTLCPRSSKVR